MILSPVLDYYRKHRGLIEENLVMAANLDDPEAIHNLRLSIKRLRVLGRLVEHLSDGAFDSKRSFTDIDSLFKTAGKVRDTQVLLMLSAGLSKNPIPDHSEFMISLKNREEKQKLKFNAALTSFDKEVLEAIEQKIIIALRDVSEVALLRGGQEVLSALIYKIRELYYSRNDEERLHDIRTRLKDINYLNNIYGEELLNASQLHVSVDRLREIGELAGSWHDHLNLEIRLMRYTDKNPDEVNPEIIQQAILELDQKKQGLLQEYTCILINEVKI